MDTQGTSAGSYDVAIVGGGTGGYATALRAAQLGKRVALIERDNRLGGTCLLRGCIPTKSLLRSAEVADTVAKASTWGIIAAGEPDWVQIKAFQTKIVDKLVKGLTQLIADRQIDVVTGQARLESGPAILVDGARITAGDIVLATGSRPRLLPAVTLGTRVVTSNQALTLDFLPTSVVVIGGGAIGLEFASFYRSMGAEVTILEALPTIAATEDPAISEALAKAYRRRRITVKVDARVQEVLEQADTVTVTFECNGATETVRADLCLVAVGRAPVSEDLGYEAAGIALERSYVKVDDELRTSLSNVWAVGDVASTPLQYAHVAFGEGIAVAERIAGLDPAPIDYDGVPRVTFCTPEVASVGLTEPLARERGHEVTVSTFNLQGLGKANILGEGGITKLVADAQDGRILGVHMVGPHVTDLISEGMLVTNWEATADELAAFIHPHPTLGEAIGEAALALAGKPLHS